MMCDPCIRGDHCGKPRERSENCFCQHRARKPRTAVRGPGGPPLAQMPRPGADGPVGAGVGSLEAVLRDVPTVVLLSAWQDFHRRHAFAAATIVRRLITDRIGRIGGPRE